MTTNDPRPVIDGNEIRHTRTVDAEANWFADREGVIRVLIFRVGDQIITTVGKPPLGQCIDYMPQALWQKIRREHEDPRPQWRGIRR